MGSLTIFLWLGILIFLMISFLYMLKCHKIDCCREKVLKPLALFHIALGFIKGTCFTAMVCVSVSMRQLTILEFLNKADKVSIVFQMFTALLILCYIIFTNYFLFFVAPFLTKKHKVKRFEKKDSLIKNVRTDFKTKQKRRHSSIRENPLL